MAHASQRLLMQSHRRSWLRKRPSSYLSPLQRGAWWWSSLAENLFPTKVAGRANPMFAEEKENGLKGRRLHTLSTAGLGGPRTTQSKTKSRCNAWLSQSTQLKADVFSCAVESRGTPRWVSSPFRGGLVQSRPARPAQMVSLNSLGNVYLMDKFRFLEQRKQMLSGSVFEASLSGRV